MNNCNYLAKFFHDSKFNDNLGEPKLYLRFAHEMNYKNHAYSNNTKDFVKMWKYVYAFVRNFNNDYKIDLSKNRIQFVFCPGNFLIEKSKKNNSNFLWMLDIDEFPSVNLISKLKNDLKNLTKYDLIMFPYVEFWDFDKPCFKLPPKKTCLINGFIYYEPFKPNICLINNNIDFKYKNSLHEVLDLDFNKINSLFCSKSGNQIVPLNSIYEEYYISHFSFPKYKKAAKINNSSFEYELGKKRLEYRKIKTAITNGKEYSTDWAKENRDYKEIEELGKNQIEQFLKVEGYVFPDLNIDKIKETNYYNSII
jgi:hypothetical protein